MQGYACSVEIVASTIAATWIRSPLIAMPFKYTIHPDLNLIRQQLWGRITAEDLRQLASDMWADPLYRKKLNILADLRQAEVDIPYDEMMEYTRFLGGNSDIGCSGAGISGTGAWTPSSSTSTCSMPWSKPLSLT